MNLEESITDARILLARAVEVIPLSVELWLALARLETPEKAKAVLNKARKAIPTSHEIWIAAGRLLEQEAGAEGKTEAQRNKELEAVDKAIEAGVRELRRHQVLLTRDQWLKEAEKCEEQGSPRTCEAIIKATVGMDVEEEDRLDTWVGDAEAAEERGKIGAARAILAFALKVFPDRRALWQKAAAVEKAHGTRYAASLIPPFVIWCSPIFVENLSMLFWSVQCTIAPRRKTYGLCQRKRNGSLMTYQVLVKFLRRPSWLTPIARKFGWRLSNLRQRMANMKWLGSC